MKAGGRQMISLKARLGLGAGALGAIALLASFLVVFGLSRTAGRIETALEAERRLQGYAMLSQQISSLALMAFEAQRVTDLGPARRDRIEALTGTIETTFDAIAATLGEEVRAADALGVDEQSRRATRGLILARMRALFGQLSATLEAAKATDPGSELNAFSAAFQPLLGSAIRGEQRLRDDAYAAVARTRAWLSTTATGLTLLSVALMLFFFFGLVRPQLARLDRLGQAARRISNEDFAEPLPETRADEIGVLFAEMNRMARDLARGRESLTRTIAERTEALRAANEKLTRTDENRRRFFADVSHEMRTPLTVILMEAELAEAAGSHQPEALAKITARARMLGRRIDDLLRLAKSDSGLLSIDRAPFDLADAARAASDDQAGRADRAGIALGVEAAGAVRVLGDRDWIRQIATGLVDNALRHAEGARTIRLRVTREAGKGMLEVIDDGGGIAPDRQEGLFQRFAQGSERTAAGGFGLGLGLAAWVAREHGGSVALVSPVPREKAPGAASGTMVALSLPLAEG